MGITAGVAAVGSTVLGYQSSQRAQRHAGQQAEVERRLAEIRNARSRRQAISDSRVQAANIEAQRAASGAGAGSSIFKAATGSVRSQVSSALGFSFQQEALGAESLRLGQKVSKEKGQAASFGALAALPGQLGLDPSFRIPGTNQQPSSPPSGGTFNGTGPRLSFGN